MAELVYAAFLFAMRSCKYTKTSRTAESKITKTIKLGNIWFYRNTWILQHDQDIDNADWVNINFEYQNNDDRNESVIMYISNHQHFWPAPLWAKIGTWVWSYQGTDPPKKRQVNTFVDTKGKISAITSTVFWSKLLVAVQILGKGQLGFGPMEMGAH